MIKKLDETYIDRIIELDEDTIFPIWNSEEIANDFLLDVFSKGQVYSYFSGEDLVGTIGFKLHKEKDSVEICFLLVKSSFEGKSVGKELMNHVERLIIEKVHRIFLEVSVQNPSVKFYKMLEFETLGKRGNKYVMEKRI